MAFGDMRGAQPRAGTCKDCQYPSFPEVGGSASQERPSHRCPHLEAWPEDGAASGSRASGPCRLLPLAKGGWGSRARVLPVLGLGGDSGKPEEVGEKAI